MDVSWAGLKNLIFVIIMIILIQNTLRVKKKTLNIVFLSVLDAPTFHALVKPIQNISVMEEDLFSILESTQPDISNPVLLGGFKVMVTINCTEEFLYIVKVEFDNSTSYGDSEFFLFLSSKTI